jgi:hypothetical protein
MADQDDPRAYDFACDNCQSRPGEKCTEATTDSRKKVAYVHLVRSSRAKAFADLWNAGPGAICQDCGHFGAHHVGMECGRCMDKVLMARREAPLSCRGMKWLDHRFQVIGSPQKDGELVP